MELAADGFVCLDPPHAAVFGHKCLATHISHLKASIDGGRVSLVDATGDRILDCWGVASGNYQLGMRVWQPQVWRCIAELCQS